MNALIEFEAGRFVDLFERNDTLGIHMFMEHMNIPLDVQDRLYNEISSLVKKDQRSIAQIIETYGQSLLSERLAY
ncbi:hypothetical protein [Shewanella salipaludis]|uniref:Uncharacterized protein n=1 Tax=Shewanella salipaludis TaxID=2723052 RepID=A0A972JKE2_9GAMM|nr:hypothetical protein [Shewanella salipaludis]NMH66110.1 hypothetical protein [Shewanella salipaludis]